MKQTAVITKVLKNGYAELSVTRRAACSSDCDSCHGCVHPEQKIVIRAENAVNASEGDTVIVESSSKKVLKAAAVFYIMPLILMALTYFIVHSSEGVKIAASIAGFAAGIVICWVVYRLFEKKNRIDFIITEILR